MNEFTIDIEQALKDHRASEHYDELAEKIDKIANTFISTGGTVPDLIRDLTSLASNKEELCILSMACENIITKAEESPLGRIRKMLKDI